MSGPSLSSQGTSNATSGAGQNLVLLTIDSLRADHCGFMGCEWDTTPTLDTLASDGVVFETAIATGPRTPSSMPVAFTGRFNRPSEFSWGDWQHRYGRISAHMQRHQTLPERLRATGYTTVAVTVNPWTQQTAFDCGFDQFIEISGETITESGMREAPVISLLDPVLSRARFKKANQWELTKNWLVQWPHYYERILEVLEGVPEPYFLWVFLLDPHQPYLAPRQYRTETSLVEMYYANYREMAGDSSAEDLPEYIQERIRRSYRDAIRSTDGFVDELLDDLPGEPAVVVHSDHGEALGEHGNWGHTHDLYEENLHVPLVVYDGDRTGRIADPVSLQWLPELVTTVATGTEYDLQDFTQDHVMAATEGMDTFALRGRRWKYITDLESEMLFDISTDPREIDECSGTHPGETAKLRHLLDETRLHTTEQNAIGEALTGLVASDSRHVTEVKR